MSWLDRAIGLAAILGCALFCWSALALPLAAAPAPAAGTGRLGAACDAFR